MLLAFVAVELTAGLESYLTGLVGANAARVGAALIGASWAQAIVVDPFAEDAAIAALARQQILTLSEDVHNSEIESPPARSVHLVMTTDGAVSLAKQRSIDLLLCNLIPREPAAHDGDTRLVELIRDLPVGANVLLLVRIAWLQRDIDRRERESLLELADLRTVVHLGRRHVELSHAGGSPLKSSRLSPTLLLAFVNLRRRNASEAVSTTFFAQLPAAPSPTAPQVDRLVSFLSNDRPDSGERSEWGFRADAATSTTWDPDRLRPERQALIAELVASSQAKELGKMAAVRPGRRPPRDASPDPDVPVVQAKDIGETLPPFDMLERFPAGPRPDRLVSLVAGDIVGSISGPVGRWAIVPEGYDGAVTGDHTVLIRLQDAAPCGPGYLLSFLRSDTAARLFVTRGATISRLDIHELRRMPVPVADASTAIVETQLAQAEEAVDLLESQLEALRAASASAFSGRGSSDIARRLAELADQAGTTIAGLHRHEDLLRRVQDLYPYPIARNVRALRLASGPRARYDELITAFESLLVYLSVVAAAWARVTDVTTPQLEQWAEHVRRNGASYGAWLGMTRSVAAAARQREDAVGGLASAMSATGRTSLGYALDQLLTERNTTHGNRPHSDDAYEDRVHATLPKLELALETAAFLVRGELIWTENVRPIDAGAGVLFEVGARRAMGDHPDWDITSHLSNSVLFEERFYLVDRDGNSLELSPFLTALRCHECGNRHVYYPDKMHERKVVLHSVDRGHQRQDSDRDLVRRVANALAWRPSTTV